LHYVQRMKHMPVKTSDPPLVVGITGASLLYWIRFLNLFVAGTLVWIGFLAAKLVFPGRQFIYFSVPILLAVWPQTTFYSIQSDLLSPLCFGIAFIGLIKFLRVQPPTVPVGIWTGLALAATCLVKTTNIALLPVVGIVLIFEIQKPTEKTAAPRAFVPLAALIISAAVPIAGWFVWNYHTFGDMTATGSKIEFLGWTRKPLANWWPHPMFTLNGVKEFWPELMASFWRGEFIWHGKRLAWQAIDAFYWVSSTLAIGLAFISLFPRSTKLTDFQRGVLCLAFSSLAVLILSVAVLSIAFDFGLCLYPTRGHPYFTSGRLLSAAGVPFFLLYSEALDRVLSRIPRQWPRIILLAGIVVFIVVAQSVVNWPAFASDYNWFHLH